jgi:rhodanese-related sulfurtransferase
MVVDVRSPAEYADGHVPGAINVPLASLAAAAPPAAVREAPSLIVYCGHGPRAYLAAMALRRWGVRNVAFLRGHMAGWRREGLPEERG